MGQNKIPPLAPPAACVRFTATTSAVSATPAERSLRERWPARFALFDAMMQAARVVQTSSRK